MKTVTDVEKWTALSVKALPNALHVKVQDNTNAEVVMVTAAAIFARVPERSNVENATEAETG